MKKSFLLFILIGSWEAFGGQILFDCQTPFNPNDPNFQQGSEVFLSIEVEENKELILKTSTFETTEVTRFNGQTSPFFLGTGSSSLGARFDTGYLSMVYLGRAGNKDKWGAFVKDGDFEKEFFCFEKMDLLSL